MVGYIHPQSAGGELEMLKRSTLEETHAIHLVGFCVLGLLALSACGKSEERDKFVGSTYAVQTSLDSCKLSFEAGGKAHWEESGRSYQMNYDVSDTEIMLAGGNHPTINIEIRSEGLYGSPCGSLLKKVS
jgi:hypothetical protein